MPSVVGDAAATEHSCGEEPFSANVIFINIDWKASRHRTRKAVDKNMALLGGTITGVVFNMNPTGPAGGRCYRARRRTEQG